MEPKVPTIAEIEEFLKAYGWTYSKTTADNDEEVLLCPYAVFEHQAVLISFRIVGEFVMVSTIDFIQNVSDEDAMKIFFLNDILKLVKSFPVMDEPLQIEVGFELWAEAWNRGTFFSFMDMLGLGIEKLMEVKEKGEIYFDSQFIDFE